MGRFRGGVVTDCRPGGKDEQEPRVLEAMDRMALARLQHQQCSRLALDDLVGGLNRNAAREHLDQSTFANLVVSNVLSSTKIKHDRSTLRLREKHLRLLPFDGRPPRRVDARLAIDELVRRSGK